MQPPMLTRRAFLGKLLRSSAALALTPDPSSRAEENALVSLELASAAHVEIPANFAGLGYEMSAIATPVLLSVTDCRFVELVKELPQRLFKWASGSYPRAFMFDFDAELEES
jgi:hypothetical protein